MLTLDDSQLEQVTPGMTVKEIREIKTSPAKEIPYFEIPGQIIKCFRPVIYIPSLPGNAGRK